MVKSNLKQRSPVRYGEQKLSVMEMVQITLFDYETIRQYGSRTFRPIPKTCKAKFLFGPQQDGSSVFELLEDCLLFKVGHKIAVYPQHVKPLPVS